MAVNNLLTTTQAAEFPFVRVYRLLTILEAAEVLACCRDSVYQAIRSGRLPVVNITPNARGRRIHPRDLEKFIAESKQCLSPSAAKSGTRDSKSTASKSAAQPSARAMLMQGGLRPNSSGKSGNDSTELAQ